MARNSRSDSGRVVRKHEPRMHLKLMRNHFSESTQRPLSDFMSEFSTSKGVTILPPRNSLSASMWASQRQTAYRFGWINAVFNPQKVLLGDDPNCLKDDNRKRGWL